MLCYRGYEVGPFPLLRGVTRVSPWVEQECWVCRWRNFSAPQGRDFFAQPAAA
jgi:hypothetical protein